MRQAISKKIEDLGRSIIGAMMLGLPLLYTMETWWLGWRMPAWLLLSWSIGGLLVISLVMHQVGFSKGEREKDKPWYAEVSDFLELFLASFVAGVIILFTFGIVELSTPWHEVVRLGFIQVVPLGLGAAITNRMLSGAEQKAKNSVSWRKEAAIGTLGAIFFALPVAPTEEMELMAAHAGPWRQVLIVLVSLLFIYLALFEMEFRGHMGRKAGMRGEIELLAGATATAYVIALLVSALLLAGYGHFNDAKFDVMVQETVVLSFIASAGGAAARVAL